MQHFLTLLMYADNSMAFDPVPVHQTDPSATTTCDVFGIAEGMHCSVDVGSGAQPLDCLESPPNRRSTPRLFDHMVLNNIKAEPQSPICCPGVHSLWRSPWNFSSAPRHTSELYDYSVSGLQVDYLHCNVAHMLNVCRYKHMHGGHEQRL